MIRADAANIIPTREQANPIPRFDRGMSARRKASYAPSLSDDVLFQGKFVQPEHDPDYEVYTWPEQIDQTQIGRNPYGRMFTDDMEIDDGM